MPSGCRKTRPSGGLVQRRSGIAEQHCHPGCKPSRRTCWPRNGNFAGLVRVNRELIGNAEAIDSPYRTVLDMDSTEIPVYGEQENSAYNGHFESVLLSPVTFVQRSW